MILELKEFVYEWWLNIKAQYPEYDYETWQIATIIGMRLYVKQREIQLN